MRLTALFPLAALLLSASPGAAGEGCPQSAEQAVRQLFEGADTNQDRSLTRAEYEDAGLQEFGVAFEESDLDADGLTSASEYLELYRKHHPPVDRSDI
ncbi:MAG: hypothetical protein FJ148_23980 [Deltaproteobacteria bacterium]|nr:hypothetical protein [Deltaproteobacteria bacterium]